MFWLLIFGGGGLYYLDEPVPPLVRPRLVSIAVACALISFFALLIAIYLLTERHFGVVVMRIWLLVACSNFTG